MVYAHRHPFDLEAHHDVPLDLFVEELPEQVQLASDCLSTSSSLSCPVGSLSTVGSVISCGKKKKLTSKPKPPTT